MTTMTSTVFSSRLKQARVAAGFSQKQLGIEASIDEFTASTRMNRYEQGIHEPDAETAKRIATALGVPRCYLYADEDDLAEIIRLYPRLNRRGKDAVLRMMKEMTNS